MNDQNKQKAKTFFLGMDAIYAEESLITDAWKKQSAERKVVYRIPLDKVQPDMCFIPLVRDKDRTPVKHEEYDPVQQKKVSKTNDPKTLVNELHQCEPVYVSKYWRSVTQSGPVDDFAAIALQGDFDVAGFIDAVNRSAAEHDATARTHHGDDHKTLTLQRT